MKAARAWSIHHLKYVWLSPIRKLDLAMTFGIPTWIQPAFSRIVCTPFSLVIDSEARGLDVHVLLTCIRVKEAITRERTLLALNVPPLQPTVGTPACKTHEQCHLVFQSVWKTKVPTVLLHPDDPLMLSQLGDYLRRLSFPGMSPTCLARQLDFIEERGVLLVEDQIIRDGCSVLEAICRAESKVHPLCSCISRH